MRLLVFFTFFIHVYGFGQVPGKSLLLGGPGQHVNFDELLGGTRSITFWIKLQSKIDSTNVIEKPIFVRAGAAPGNFNTGAFAIYFGKTGTPEAGNLVFLRATEFADYQIKSNSKNWNANQWYHIAAVLHPQNGMQLFVNGMLQQNVNASTEPVYLRNEGPTGPLFLGKWGNIGGYGIVAEFDEIRFSDFAFSELEIRNGMCRTVLNTGLKAYYNFDNASPLYIPSQLGSFMGLATGLSLGSIVPSNAPVGEQSNYMYNFNASSSLTITNQATLTVDSFVSAAPGVHVYATTMAPIQNGPSSFLGVWFTDSVTSYRTQFDFSSVSNTCDSCSELWSRDFQTITKWTVRPDFAISCVYTLPNESPGPLPYREEYYVIPQLEFNSGLRDTITQCEGTFISLNPALYPGGTYQWEDGTTLPNRVVSKEGMYYLTIKWHGCELTDSIYAQYKFQPYFNLPNDTAICIGDTLVLVAPLNIDSAIYDWGNGLHYGRTFRMYYAGTISLRITVGKCSWVDWITVDVIKNFQLNIGADTTLCLGQELVLYAPDGVKCVWSNGSTSAQQRIFNQPQKIWIDAWNKCFAKSDTIHIKYEECACHFYIANAFSPNNDGINDVFLPVTSCYYEEFELMIFDRWGNQVFLATQLNQGWDGTYKGKKLPQGVFSYQLRYKKYTWHELSMYQRGTLTLIE